MCSKEKISIDLPGLDEQQSFILEQETQQAIDTLKNNLLAERYPKSRMVDYGSIDPRVYLSQERGWQPPPPELIDAWFTQVKSLFTDYSSDEKLGNLLGIHGKNGGRRIRAYRNGDEVIPYGVWRKFLELTGRVAPDIRPVLGIFDS